MLQHALTRVWDAARTRPGPVRLELKDLQAVDPKTAGTLFIEKHLNQHLDSLFGRLTALADAAERRRIVEALFKQLGDFDAKGRLVRRPCSLAMAEQVCGAGPDDILSAVEVFRDRANGQSFLMPPLERTDALRNGEDDFGICHEALLRHWETLGAWIQQEAKDANAYRALAGRAVAVEKPNPLRGAELRHAETLRKRVMSEAWCRRYQGAHDPVANRNQYDYVAATAYLARSRRLQLMRVGAIVGAVLIAVPLAITYSRTLLEARDKELQLAASQESREQLATANTKLTKTLGDLSQANTTLTTTVKDLEKSRAALGEQIGKTQAALADAQQKTREADAAQQAAEQRRLEADVLRETAEQRLGDVTEARNELAATAEQLRQANKRIEASAAQHGAEQNLRLLAAAAPNLNPQFSMSPLFDLATSAEAYATMYGELPTVVSDALKRAFAYSYLKAASVESSDPVLLATAVPEPSDRLRVIRRGDKGQGLGLRVPRKEWSIQRATVASLNGDVLVGGAGGYVTLAATGSTKAITRKLHPFAVTGLGVSTDGVWVASASAAGDMRLLRKERIEHMSVFTDRFLQFGNATKLVTFLISHAFKGDYAVRDFALSVPTIGSEDVSRRDISVVALTDAGRAIVWTHPGPFGKQISGLDDLSVGSYTAIATNPASQEVWMTSGSALERLVPFTKRTEECESMQEIARLGGIAGSTPPVSSLAWDSKGTRLAMGFRDGTVHVLTKVLPGGCGGISTELVIPAHTTAITTLVWQQGLLASGASDGTAFLWALPETADEKTLARDLRALGSVKGAFNAVQTMSPSDTSLLGRLKQYAQAPRPVLRTQ
jgi:hypothetical protein